MEQKHWFIIAPFVFFLLNFIGCATLPSVLPPRLEGIPGIYHRVEKGETLWRLSKMYNLDLDELVSINHISDATNIEVGQLIFIPQRQKPQLPLIQSRLEDFIWPIKGRVITTFGQVFNDMINKGINIQTYADTEVVASRSGKVIFYSPNFKGFGKTIIVDHGDGFLTVYARNSEALVKIGDQVQKGTAISKVGSRGRDKSTYLHFEIRKSYIPQNPYFYLSR